MRVCLKLPNKRVLIFSSFISIISKIKKKTLVYIDVRTIILISIGDNILRRGTLKYWSEFQFSSKLE